MEHAVEQNSLLVSLLNGHQGTRYIITYTPTVSYNKYRSVTRVLRRAMVIKHLYG